jgi:hypothetical protein
MKEALSILSFLLLTSPNLDEHLSASLPPLPLLVAMEEALPILSFSLLTSPNLDELGVDPAASRSMTIPNRHCFSNRHPTRRLSQFIEAASRRAPQHPSQHPTCRSSAARQMLRLQQ